jgi:hypothetical protein
MQGAVKLPSGGQMNLQVQMQMVGDGSGGGGSGGSFRGSGAYRAVAGHHNPGNDIACGQRQWNGAAAPWCRICGGQDSVEAACNRNVQCVAYDMESVECGYLKRAAGPLAAKSGFYSFIRQGGSGGGQQQQQQRAGRQFRRSDGSHIPGNDLPCAQGSPFCRVCGPRAAVESACNGTPGCAAYVMDNGGCGYLKRSSGPVQPKGGFTAFTT